MSGRHPSRTGPDNQHLPVESTFRLFHPSQLFVAGQEATTSERRCETQHSAQLQKIPPQHVNGPQRSAR
jgi:hypothetical protein